MFCDNMLLIPKISFFNLLSLIKNIQVQTRKHFNFNLRKIEVETPRYAPGSLNILGTLGKCLLYLYVNPCILLSLETFERYQPDNRIHDFE